MAKRTTMTGPFGTMMTEGKNRRSDKVLSELVNRHLTLANPTDEDDDWETRFNQLMYELAAAQEDTSTWTEEKWREVLAAKGYDEDQIVDALDMIASWGVTDDDTNET